jgi:putative flavoprotein involved in K+ transport
VAMANWQRPWVPPFAAELDPDIVQLHAGEYRNPSQLRDGAVLIVGAGNSGAEIAREAAHSHHTWISGRDNGQLPFDIDGAAARFVLLPLVLRFLFHHALTVNTPMGRKVRSKVLSHGMPRLRIRQQDLIAAGIERVGRTVGVRDGQPLLADGRVLDVANVVWCTGFQPDFSWIDLPVFGNAGEPIHERGVVAGQPGLYFVGLLFLYAPSSAMVHGVGRDAANIVDAIASGARAARSAAARRPMLPPAHCEASHVMAGTERSTAD